MRVLIIEDTPERQEILINLVKDHAWILVNTVARARRMLENYTFDLIFLDYDLAGEQRGDEVASSLMQTGNATTKVIVHSMNAPGAERIKSLLPAADIVPLSKITRDNATFKKLRGLLRFGPEIDWARVFGRR